MDAPPLNRRWPAVCSVALLALALPAGVCSAREPESARRGFLHSEPRPTPSDLATVDDSCDEHAAVVAGLARRVQPVVSVLALSRYDAKKRPIVPVVTAQKKQPPAYSPPPLVVKPPIQPAQYPKPPGQNPGPGPKGVPEPGSLGAGLVGGSLMLAAWWRERRRRQRTGVAAKAGPEPEMA